MAQFDLTSRMGQYLDRHLVFPLLEFLSVKEIYDEKEMLKGKLDLLSNTNMVDFAMDVHKNLYPDEEVVQALKDKRVEVLSRLVEMQGEVNPIVTIFETEEVTEKIQNTRDGRQLFDFLVKNYDFKPEMLDTLFSVAKFQYECGNYSATSENLYFHRILIPGNDKNALSGMWGKLAAEILLQNWEVALDDLHTLKDYIDANSFSSALQSLQQRTWLIHWSLFIFFNHPKGRDLIIDMCLYQTHYLNAIQTTCPHICLQKDTKNNVGSDLNEKISSPQGQIPSLFDINLSPLFSNKNSGQKGISPFKSLDIFSRIQDLDKKTEEQESFNSENQFINNFILFEDNKEAEPYEILRQSATFSFVQLIPKFHVEQRCNKTLHKCMLLIDGDFLCEGIGETKTKAQNNASSLALEKLKKCRPTIRVKENNYISGTVITHMEIFGEEDEIDEDFRNNIAVRNGGFGGRRHGNTDYNPSSKHYHVFNHRNPRDYRNDIMFDTFTPIIEKFLSNLWLDELAFDAEFSNSERFIIHQICENLHLSSISQGVDNNRFLVIRRIRTGHQLLQDLIQLGGSTSKYELIRPKVERLSKQ